MKKSFLLLLFMHCLLPFTLFAQGSTDSTSDSLKKNLPPIQKFFVGSALDGAIFSTATIQNSNNAAGQTVAGSSLGIIRFSLIVNVGVTFNFNLNRHFGIYTGVDLKNIGFIEKNDAGETVKRRSYNLGAPVGIKFGNMAKDRAYLFLGGGIDVPIEYKEKIFVIRNEKTKINDWLSDRTPAIMPYVFAGFAINRGATFKIQYYPGNFLNPNFITSGSQPYAGMDVHLILLSLGLNIRYGKHPDIVVKHIAELRTM